MSKNCFLHLCMYVLMFVKLHILLSLLHIIFTQVTGILLSSLFLFLFYNDVNLIISDIKLFDIQLLRFNVTFDISRMLAVS